MNRDSLFTATKIGNSALKNRFVVAPLTRGSANGNGVPTMAMQAYYAAMAKGGFSAIITECIYIDDPRSVVLPNQPGIVTQQQIDAWSGIVNALHQHGSVAIAQLVHAGALSMEPDLSIAPSAVRPVGLMMAKSGAPQEPYAIPKAMDDADIQQVVHAFVSSAKAAQLAGFDGVELHAANGYLLDQFITPHTNLRNDEYGGSMKNRLRIIEQIVEGVRTVLGNDFIIGLRVSESKVNDLPYRWPDGAQYAHQLFTQLAKFNISYIHIAAEGGNWERECAYAGGSSSCSIARQITGLPIIANGGLHDLQKAEILLETGHADLFAIGRAAIADPEWVNKMEQGIDPIPFEKGMINPLFTLANTADYFREKYTLPVK